MDKSLMDDKQEMAEIGRDCIESAYCFIHQKLRVYEFSTTLRSGMISNMQLLSMWRE